jgi:hypothetical protein
MRALVLATVAALSMLGCRATYVAPEPRTVATLSPSRWGMTDSGDTAAIRRAEQACIAGLSPRAVSAAFQAVDEVAEALVDLCSIRIVNDDPLVWHVWCGSDATFQSGHYLAPQDGSVACEGETASTAFECIGRILGRHVLTSDMRQHVEGVEIVSVGSVDAQRLSAESQFLADPCTELQSELGLAESMRWTAPETPPSDAERAEIWNRRLSWCRAGFAAREMRRGMARQIGGRYELAAIGAGTDWLEDWRRTHRGRLCPTASRADGRGECEAARRVDLFVRVRAQQGEARAESCRPPANVPGGEAGQALYCYADCQARAAIGRNPQGFQAPSSAPDLLFGRSRAEPPPGWIVDRSVSGGPVNTSSVRDLLLRSE